MRNIVETTMHSIATHKKLFSSSQLTESILHTFCMAIGIVSIQSFSLYGGAQIMMSQCVENRKLKIKPTHDGNRLISEFNEFCSKEGEHIYFVCRNKQLSNGHIATSSSHENTYRYSHAHRSTAIINVEQHLYRNFAFAM